MNNKLAKTFFLIIPFIDLITALMTRHLSTTLTLGVIIKTLFIFLLTLYIFKTKSKYKKISLFSILFIIFYIFSYFIFKIELLSTNYILKELQFLFKLIYFPITFFGLLCFLDDKKIEKKDITKILRINLITYTILLIIPIILNNAYTTYPLHLKGYIGWFYAGNEIANIMILLFPFSFYYLYKHPNKYAFLILLPITYIIFSIGTKVATFGIIIIYFITLILSLIKYKFDIKNLKLLICVLFSLFLLSNSYAIYNYNYMKEYNIDIETPTIIVDENNKEEVNEITNQIENFYQKNNFNKILSNLVSGRDILLANTISVYNDAKTDSNILFGIGFSNTEKINNSNIARLIEIDICDLYFHFGIIGLFISFSPFLYLIYLLIKNRIKFTSYRIYLYLLILLTGGISTLSGHVLLAPAVSTYLVLYLLLLIADFNLFTRKKLKNKISILALHLNYGGIEKAITDQANMLSTKYKVEIVSIYKFSDNIPYNLNKNVKIKYLSNLKPNKNEIKIALSNKKLIKFLKELIKAGYILIQKRRLMSTYIYNCDSNIIISSRIFITKLLNDYGNPNALKIAQEHVYHNNNYKYLKKVNKYTKNIDYLMTPSKYITDDYKKLIKSNVSIKYIPLTIDYIPPRLNKLNNKNIISVGRLEPEKGYFDMLKVLKEVIKEDNEIKLTIVGDGSEFKRLNDYVKTNNLTSNIKFTGYLNKKNLYNEYKKASLLLNTSFEESFGLTFIEAMSYGIPAISFSSALSAKEIIEDKFGKIIENRDIKEMAKEIINYFNEKKENINKLCREKALNYDLNKVKDEWLLFLEKALIKKKSKKLLFISSAGGHFNELLELKETINKYNSFIITEYNDSTKSYINEYGNRIYYLLHSNRKEISYIYKFPVNIIKSFYKFIKIMPDVIITTGAHTSVPMCYIGKIFGKKIIYIETFANIKTKSLSGKLVYPIADVFIVQWKEMLKLYPKAIYEGWIY